MVSGDPAKMSELAIRALFQVGRRGVVVGGWANLSPSLLPQDMPDTKVTYALIPLFPLLFPPVLCQCDFKSPGTSLVQT